MLLDPDTIAARFTQRDGTFRFARWGRPVAPVVFGVEDSTIGAVHEAFRSVFEIAGLPMAQVDPELGANLMVFFVRDWDELRAIPDLDRLIPELAALVPRLAIAGASHYRLFRFDAGGAIRAAFVFLCMDAAMSEVPASTLALNEAVRVVLLWSDQAFDAEPALVAQPGGAVGLRPDMAALIRSAYDPVLPDATGEPALCLRLAARAGR